MKENGSSGLRAKTNELFKKLKAAGEPIWYVKTSGNPYQRPGVPDFIVCYGGVFGALELKSPGEVPTTKQTYELKWVDTAFGVAWWADSIEGVEQFLSCLKAANPQGLARILRRENGHDL
jgi:hypothetical protein